MSSRDRFLNAIHQGGASLVAFMRISSARVTAGLPEEATFEAHDRGNGSYSVDCSLTQACDFEVCSANPCLCSGMQAKDVVCCSFHVDGLGHGLTQ